MPGTGQPQPIGPGVAPNTQDGPPQADLSSWSFWWAFNKSGYIGLRDMLEAGGARTGSSDWYLGMGQAEQAVDISRPSPEQVNGLVVPALLRTLATETNKDVVTGALMALAKIGDTTAEDGSSPLSAAIQPWLADSSQEISETAALCLGILGHERDTALLLELLADTKTGRRATARGEVPRRTRSFAAYALGLAGRTTASDLVKASILDGLRAQLTSSDSASRDVVVACVTAMGLFTPAATGSLPSLDLELDGAASLTSSEAQLQFLMQTFRSKLQSSFVRGHAPTAMVRVLELASPELRASWREPLAEELLAAIADPNEANQVVEGCVLALGALGDCDQDPLDRRIRASLISVPKKLRDQQARNFSLISLAQLASRAGDDDSGLPEIQQALLARLSGSNNALRPWSALAIGVLARSAKDRFPAELVLPIKLEIAQQRGPKVSAYAVAAGLIGDEVCTDVLLEKLDTIRDDTARGYICLALGMIGDRRASEAVLELVKQSTYRADLLRQAAIGLGLLGDHAAVDELLDALERSRSLATKAAVAGALGTIGDRRSIAPLIELLEDQDGTAMARGFAAAALGDICTPDRLPWNAPIASNINYRAATETLTGLGGRGILDIL